MTTQSENYVPKVHPKTRPVEAEDPMELVATPAPGDPDVMLECIVQEFAWMGMGADELLGLFQSPAYPVLNQLLHHYGEGAIRQRVRRLLASFGGLRVSAVINDEPEPGEDGDLELIALSLTRLGNGRN